jgi:4-hydroxy-3-methylbut-2-enyl diphosphate reductase
MPGHPETIGTMGQLPEGEVMLVETVEDVASVEVRDPERLAFVTQTTLSVDDTADIVAALQARFPSIVGPHKEDICYATTNRQEAVKAMAPKADAMLVIGAPNSSNSKRLVEVGRAPGANMRSWCSAPPTSTGARWRGSRRWASPPAPARRRCWSTR